jgi:gliding motility-associated-like protein
MVLLKKGLVLVVLVLCIITAHAQPVADFTANKLSGCSPLSVQFTDNSTGGATSWSWSFGNSNSSTLQNPSATYVVPGTYTVSLTATNSAGSNTKTRLAYITVFTPPVANLTTSVTGGCAPLTVPFTNLSTAGSSPLVSWLWDFGDGSIGTISNPSHLYSTSGVKNISLTVTDSNGCSHSVIKNALISVTQSHTIDFTVSNPIVCKAPSVHTVTSLVSPPNPNYIYEWVTSGGVNANTPSFNINNILNGPTRITLKVKSPSGCEAVAVKDAAIFAVNLDADYTSPSIASLCSGTNLIFNNITTPDTSVINYNWFVNGVNVSSLKNLVQSFPQGNHLVKLQSSFSGCTDTISKTIVVNPRPTASFTSQPNTICFVPVKLGFVNTSTGNGLTSQWNFDNLQTSSNTNDSGLFIDLRPHYVKLIVTNNLGCTDSTINKIDVLSLTAQVNALNQKKGCAPYTANFAVQNPSLFTTFKWILDGVLVDTAAAFSHIISDTGVHVMKLVATNANGCFSEVIDTVLVGSRVIPDFTSNKQTGCFNGFSPVQFTAIESSGLPNSSLTFLWEWKSGSIIQRNPSISFNDTGSYDMKLTLIYLGCETEVLKSNYINIYPAKAAINNPVTTCGSDSVLFDALSSYGKNKFYWDFGDSITSDLPVINHRYVNFGIHQVRMVVMDTTTNCSDTINTTVQVAPPPGLDFVVNDSLGCAPLLTKLHNTSVFTAVNYPVTRVDWRYTTNQTTVGNDTSLYLYAGGYHGLRMTVTDSRGCTYSVYKDSVVLVPTSAIMLAVNPQTGCVPLTVNTLDSSTATFPIVKRKWYWDASLDTTTLISGNSASHTYNQASNIQKDGYTLVFEITDSLGCVFSANKNIIPSKPIPKINRSEQLYCGGQQLTCIADTSSTNIYGPATFRWGIGSLTANGYNLTRNYTQADTTLLYKLIVTDANGCIDSVETLIDVHNHRPQIGFFATPQTRACYLPIVPVTLFDTTIVGTSAIASRIWRVGENTSSLLTPAFIFSKPGKYNVTLTITDSAGCIDSLAIPDYIFLGGPIGTYQIAPKSGCIPLAVQFNVQSANALYRIWDFGNGLVDTIESPSFYYPYNDAGKSVPRLTLVDSSALCTYVFDAIDTLTVYPTPEVNFTYDKALVCYNTSVLFSNQTPNKSAVSSWKWLINNSDSFSIEGPLNYVFNTAGTFSVTLIAVDTNGCSDTLTKNNIIDVYSDTNPPPSPPAIVATVVDDASVSFTFQSVAAPDFTNYKVYYNYSGGIPSNSTNVFVNTDTVFVHTNINTLLNPYSYAVSSVDVCGNMSDTSITHTTVELTARPLTNSIGLKWTPYVGFAAIKQYEVWRNNPDSGTNFVKLVSLNSNQTQYIDNTAKCFTNYLYKIKTVSGIDNSIVSWSDTSGATPVYLTNLPGTDIFTATVVNNDYVLLQWMKRDADLRFKYMVYRMRDDENTYTYYKEVTDTFLIDHNVDVALHCYSYVIYLKDDCGGLSMESNPARTILLKVRLEPNDLLKYDPFVSFNNYSYWVNGVSKNRVDFRYDNTGMFSGIADLSPSDTTYLHKYNNLLQRDYCYRITAFENGGNLATSQSNIACIETKPIMYAPTAFTINNDNLNERFIIKGVFIETFHLVIYDRWGKAVFETSDLEKGWDGDIDGKPAAPGVYVYIAEGTGRKGQPAVLQGSITLLR